MGSARDGIYYIEFVGTYDNAELTDGNHSVPLPSITCDYTPG